MARLEKLNYALLAYRAIKQELADSCILDGSRMDGPNMSHLGEHRQRGNSHFCTLFRAPRGLSVFGLAEILPLTNAGHRNSEP